MLHVKDIFRKWQKEEKIFLKECVTTVYKHSFLLIVILIAPTFAPGIPGDPGGPGNPGGPLNGMI